MSTVTYESAMFPRVTLTKDAGFYTAVLEVEGLAPVRATTQEERFVGVTSLDPPTARVRIRTDLRKTWRQLIEAAQRAVAGSATSTTGETGGPGALLMTHFRVACAVRGALRLLGEDI